MPARTPDQREYWSRTNEVISQKLKAYYQACTTEEFPPLLLELLKKLEEEGEPSPEHVKVIHPQKDRK